PVHAVSHALDDPHVLHLKDGLPGAHLLEGLDDLLAVFEVDDVRSSPPRPPAFEAQRREGAHHRSGHGLPLEAKLQVIPLLRRGKRTAAQEGPPQVRPQAARLLRHPVALQRAARLFQHGPEPLGARLYLHPVRSPLRTAVPFADLEPRLAPALPQELVHLPGQRRVAHGHRRSADPSRARLRFAAEDGGQLRRPAARAPRVDARQFCPDFLAKRHVPTPGRLYGAPFRSPAPPCAAAWSASFRWRISINKAASLAGSCRARSRASITSPTTSCIPRASSSSRSTSTGKAPSFS